MNERAAFKRHRFLKVLAIVTVAGALCYCVGAIKPFVDARNVPFESALVYYVNGSDFVRILDSSSGVYYVSGSERESFHFLYNQGNYSCSYEGKEWNMRLVSNRNLLDLRSGVYLWGTEV